MRRYLSLPVILGVFFILLVGIAIPLTVNLLKKTPPNENKFAVTPSTLPPVYWGAFVGNPNITTNITDFEALAQKKLSIVHWYLSWKYSGFPTSTVNSIRSLGSIPMISWDSHDPSNLIGSNLKSIYSGTFDGYITKWAQDSKSWGHPYFLRLDWEMNGSWSPFYEGNNGNQLGDFVKMWRHVHNIFTNNGVTNVTWVWCPNTGIGNLSTLSELYPGDGYVDWTCLDGYNWGTTQTWSHWQSFSTIFGSTYSILQQLAPTKPLMIGETASTEQGGSKATWITNSYQTEIPSYPNIRAVLWFNVNKETDWRINSSLSSQNAFVAGIAANFYTSNQYANFDSSPIPPPQNTAQTSVSSPTPTIPTPTLTPTKIPTPTPTPTISNKKVHPFNPNKPPPK